MKNKVLIISLIVIILVIGIITGYYVINRNNSNSSSNNNQNTTNNNINETIKISLNEIKSIKDNDKEINIKFESVKDERCPKNVECYWSGEIIYYIEVNKKDEELKTVTKTSIDYNEYTIKLADNNDSLEYVNLIINKK